MGIKIVNFVHYTTFRKDGKRVPMLEVHYETPKGFAGIVHVEEQGATEESISTAILKAASLPEKLIGETITVKK